MYQNQYWVELQNLKTHAYYLEFYQLRCERIELFISIILAITSSASIGAWAIWKEAAIVWGAVIALSQVLSVVYRYLPFKSRIKPLGIACVELSILADDAESGWYAVSEGLLSEEEINERRFKIRKAKSAVMKSAFIGISLPENKKLLDMAGKKMEIYFNNHYPRG